MTGQIRLVVVLLTVALVVMAGSSLALANEGDIEVQEATAVSQFPDGIMFQVSAMSEGIVDEARVFITKADQSGRSSYRRIDLEHGTPVVVEPWHHDAVGQRKHGDGPDGGPAHIDAERHAAFAGAEPGADELGRADRYQRSTEPERADR